MDATSPETTVYITDGDYLNTTSLESLTNSTERQSNTPELMEYDVSYNFANDFYFYGLSIVIPFGLIGNAFSVFTFLMSTILRRTTTGQFLVALAFADSTVLVGDMMRWLAHTKTSGEYYMSPSLGLNRYNTSLAACTITLFLRYGGSLCSVWLTVAIALERLFAVAFPLKISRISTLRRSRIFISVITIISYGLALYPFFSFQIKATGCAFKNKTTFETWNKVIIISGTLIIPGVVIAILTFMIIVLLYRARKKRISQLASCMKNVQNLDSKLGLSTETQLTVMLVAVCVATTALRAPYMIAYYLRHQICLNPDTKCSALGYMQSFVAIRVTEVFNTVNFAINFILYCLSGSLFRRQIRMTLIQEAASRNCLRNRPATPETQQLEQLE